MQNQAERLADVGSWEIDLSTGSRRGSDSCCACSDLTQDDSDWSSGDPQVVFDLVHPEDRDRVRATLVSAIASGEPFEYEGRLLRDDGEERWLRFGATCVSTMGSRRCCRGFMQDITQRREAERAVALAAAARERCRPGARDRRRSSAKPATGETFQSVHLEVATYYQAGVEGTPRRR